MAKSVDFIIGIKGDAEAKQKFIQLDKAISNTAVTTSGKLSPALQNVSRRDLGIFATQMLYSADITGRLGSQLSNLATGLATGGVIGAAFAGAAALISLIGDEAKTAAEELKKLSENIQGLFKIQKEGGFFNLLTGDVGGALATLQQRLAQETQKLNILRTTGTLAGQVESQANIAILKESIIQLEKIKNAETERGKIVKILTDAGLVYTKELEAQTKELDKQKITLEKIAKITGGEAGNFPSIGVPPELRNFGFPGKDRGRGKERAEMAELTDYFKKLRDLGEEFSSTFSFTLEGNLHSVWENTFGEANSFAEQFISNISEKLFAQFATNVFGSILNFILPGSGSVFSAVFSAARSIQSSASFANRYRMGE